MDTGLKVLDAMTKRPVTVSHGTKISKAAEKMKQEKVGSVLIQKKGKLIGILSEQDLVYKIVAHGLDPKETRVNQIMTKDVVTISPDEDIREAMIRMNKSNVRRLPVTHNTKIVGMLTMKDILKIEPELFELIIDKFDLKEEKSKPIHRVGEREGICQMCGNYTDFLFDQEDIFVCIYCKE